MIVKWSVVLGEVRIFQDVHQLRIFKKLRHQWAFPLQLIKLLLRYFFIVSVLLNHESIVFLNLVVLLHFDYVFLLGVSERFVYGAFHF